MRFRCKKCDADMQIVFYEGVTIQLCMDCKSVFLSKKKLEIIEKSREIGVSDDFFKPGKGSQILRDCPQCDIVMKKVSHGKIRSNMIDYCEKCTGIWLDKGELVSIQFSYEIAEGNKSGNWHRYL